MFVRKTQSSAYLCCVNWIHSSNTFTHKNMKKGVVNNYSSPIYSLYLIKIQPDTFISYLISKSKSTYELFKISKNWAVLWRNTTRRESVTTISCLPTKLAFTDGGDEKTGWKKSTRYLQNSSLVRWDQNYNFLAGIPHSAWKRKIRTVSSQFTLMQLCFGLVTKKSLKIKNYFKKIKKTCGKMCLSSFTQYHAT